MMPVNDAYPVARLMEAVRRYQDVTVRRVSFEYSMVRGGQRLGRLRPGAGPI